MSEPPAWVPKQKLVYQEPDMPTGEVRNISFHAQITRALVSIANSLAIIADETEEMSPILHAAFTIGDAMDTEDEPTTPIARGRAS